MNKVDFLIFYDHVVKEIGMRLKMSIDNLGFVIIQLLCMKNISIKRRC